jgi:hypothetical protein
MFIRRAKYMVLLAALGLMVPFSALARSKNECKVVFSEAVQVGTTQLQAGTYKVEWKGDTSSLDVSFLKNGKTVATAQGKMIEKKKSSDYDQIITNAAGATKRLEEIDFGGKKDALVFESNQTAMK